MEPNGPVLQAAEIILYFVKKTPNTLWQLWNDGMACLELECLYDSNGMVWSEVVLEREWYGMGFPSHGTMELVWSHIPHLGLGTVKVR